MGAIVETRNTAKKLKKYMELALWLWSGHAATFESVRFESIQTAFEQKHI